MDQRELEQFIRQHGREIYSFCCYLTKSRQEADDLYQDAFVKVLEMSKLPEAYEGTKNLILGVTVRLWKDKKRKFARRRRIAEERFYPQAAREGADTEATQTPEAFVLEQEKLTFVRACVDTLPEKMKPVVLLYYMEGRTTGEIAEVLHIPQGTVKSRLFQAKKLLSEKLSRYKEEWI